MGGQSGRPCEAVRGHARLKWEAEVGGRSGRPTWEAKVGGRSGRPCEAEVGGHARLIWEAVRG